VDIGVDSANSIGIISATPKVSVKGITNADSTPPTTANSTCATANKLNESSINLSQGTSAGGILWSINEKDALVGEIESTIIDKAMVDKIKEQKSQNLCGSGDFPCPFPVALKLKFEYEVVPNDFKIELLDKNGNALKVLYFGQGSTPDIEEGSKVRFTALKSDKKAIATTFSQTCSSQNLAVEIKEIAGKGFALEILGKDGSKPLIVSAKDFKNGIAESSAIVKVDKDKDIPFTPNMKSEPIFTNKNFPNGIPSEITFAQFPNSYYPKYDSTLDNELLILRARINAIDTDNQETNFNTASNSKVFYEFQCEYCNLTEVGKVTGVNNYEKSKTQQGWWID
ncbi:hypothetical protein, partial [Helicobacter sp. 23-1045]